ncbi:hypothetical protein STEG23_003210 [Scotinomys teguina]
MTVTPLGRDQDCSLKNREPDVPASWFLDPGGWSKTAAVGLYFIFPGICTLSIEEMFQCFNHEKIAKKKEEEEEEKKEMVVHTFNPSTPGFSCTAIRYRVSSKIGSKAILRNAIWKKKYHPNKYWVIKLSQVIAEGPLQAREGFRSSGTGVMDGYELPCQISDLQTVVTWQMTMERVESQQDRSVTQSMAERSSAHMQTGQISVPTLAQDVLFIDESKVFVSSTITVMKLICGSSRISFMKGVHPFLVATIEETDDSAESEIIDSHKRREILSRRPSYRKILNELSSDVPGIPKIEEEKSEEEGTPPNIATMAVPTSIYQTSTGQYIAIAQGGTIQISNPGSDGVQGLQALTMTNSGAPPPGATIVQYAAQSADGTQQFFVPGSQVVVQDEETDLAPSHMAAATGDMPTYQIRAPTTALPQGVVMAASPGSLHNPQQLAEEATRKRELRLMKNREAARECRRKKKEYVKCLENRVAVLENQNKTLIEELKALKDLYCHKAEEAAKECRRRKKEYVKCLESRVAVLEVQNKKLIEELETLKDICSPKTD